MAKTVPGRARLGSLLSVVDLHSVQRPRGSRFVRRSRSMTSHLEGVFRISSLGIPSGEAEAQRAFAEPQNTTCSSGPRLSPGCMWLLAWEEVFEMGWAVLLFFWVGQRAGLAAAGSFLVRLSQHVAP